MWVGKGDFGKFQAEEAKIVCEPNGRRVSPHAAPFVGFPSVFVRFVRHVHADGDNPSFSPIAIT